MEDKLHLLETIPLLTGSPFFIDLPLNSKIYCLRDDISILFNINTISIPLFLTLKQLLTIENLMKFDYLSIRNLIIALKQIKPMNPEGTTANPLFISGIDILTTVLKYHTSQQIIQDLINFYIEIPPIHSSFFIDYLKSKNGSSEIYYSFSGIASFISTVIKIDLIPQDCYTLYTQIKYNSIHPDATPCLFSFNANNYFFSLSIDGLTETLELDINVVTSSDPSVGSPSIMHIRNTYKTPLKVLPDKWNEISLVHFRESNTMKIVLNGEGSKDFDVPYFSSKQNQAIISIGGLDSKSYSYFNGDISLLAWYFDQVSPSGIPTLLLSPKNYAAMPSHSFIKPLKSIKNRVVSKEIKIIKYTVCTPSSIFVVVTRSLNDVFATYGGVSIFLPLLRSGSNTKVTSNIGKLLQLFLHCKTIDTRIATTLIIETTKIAQDYLVSTSIVDDFIKLCMSLISRGYSTSSLLPLMMDIRLWRGAEYLFEYYVKEIMSKCSILDPLLLKDVMNSNTVLSILTDKICSPKENWKWLYLVHLSGFLSSTSLSQVFSLLQAPHLSINTMENYIGIILCLTQKYSDCVITLNNFIDTFLTLAQYSKMASLLVTKLFSLIQPTSDQLTQLTQILSIYPFDYEMYCCLLECANGSVSVPLTPFSSIQLSTVQNPQYLYMIFSVLSSQTTVESVVVDDLSLMPNAILQSLPLNFLMEILKTIKKQSINVVDEKETSTQYRVLKGLINFLCLIVVVRDYEIIQPIISFFISQTTSANNLHLLSHLFLIQLSGSISKLSTNCYIELLTFIGFVHSQRELPLQLISKYVKSPPNDYYTAMTILRSKKEYKTLFYLQSYSLSQCIDEEVLSLILQLYPPHIPPSFCQFIVQTIKSNEKLLQIALNNFVSVVSSAEYKVLVEYSKQTNKQNNSSSLKSFIESIILQYKECYKITLNKTNSLTLPNVPLSLLPFEGNYTDIITNDKIRQIELTKCHRKTMKSAVVCNPFFQQNSTQYVGFVQKFLYPTNPVFLTRVVLEPPIKLLSYENLYLPDTSQFSKIPCQGCEYIDCLLKKPSVSVCCKMTLNATAREIKIWKLQTYHIIKVDDMREIFSKLSNGLLCALEFVQRRGSPLLISFENEKMYALALQKISLFLEKVKSSVVINPPNKLNGSILKAWSDGLLSNYEYIASLNCYASRSLESVDTYYVFPSIEDNEVTSNLNESLMEHSANTCCLLYTHMPFTRILPLFQLRVAKPPPSVRDIRLITCNCVPQVYSSQKIYSGMGGSDDGISYGNKPTIMKPSDPRSIQVAQSPKLGSSALEVVYKKRRGLESVEVQNKLANWFNVIFGKKSMTPISNLVVTRRKCIDFNLERNSKEKKISVTKENLNLTSSVVCINVQRNLVIQTELSDIIVNEGRDVRSKNLNGKNDVKRVICCDKMKSRIIVSYQLNANSINILWKDYLKTIRIENIVSYCYLMETEYICDLELFVITKAGSVMVYRIFLDDKNSELKIMLAFTVFVGESIKSFSACTSFGYMICNTSSTLSSYSLHDGAPIYIIPSTSKIMCCSALGQVYSISGNILACYDRYGEMYNIFELNDFKYSKIFKMCCLTCGYEDIIFIATNQEIVVLINSTTTFDILEQISINRFYPNYSVFDIIAQPTIGTSFNPSNWNVYVQVQNKETLACSYCTLHVECFKTITLK